MAQGRRFFNTGPGRKQVLVCTEHAMPHPAGAPGGEFSDLLGDAGAIPAASRGPDRSLRGGVAVSADRRRWSISPRIFSWWLGD